MHKNAGSFCCCVSIIFASWQVTFSAYRGPEHSQRWWEAGFWDSQKSSFLWPFVDFVVQKDVFNRFVDLWRPHNAEFTGIFLLGSKFSHSCAPNASWSFDSAGRLQYRAIRSIAAGEVLTFSYVGNGICVEKLEDVLKRPFWNGLAFLKAFLVVSFFCFLLTTSHGTWLFFFNRMITEKCCKQNINGFLSKKHKNHWGMNLITSTFIRRQRLAQLCFVCGCQRCAAKDFSRRIRCPSSCGGFCCPEAEV